MTAVEAALRAEILRRGSIPFREVVERALYAEDGGFYASGGRAGRRGDFLTSPEVGPLFGAVVANALDSWWEDAGRPDELVVVEAGAGPGALARSVLAAGPRCIDALRYVLVERAAAQRALHGRHLPLDGPNVVSVAELPPSSGPCIVLANELLDNLPFDLLERTADRWAEVHVGLEGDDLVEVLVPTDEAPPVDAPVGARAPRQRAASAWVDEARALAGDGGRVVVVDYTATTAELVQRPWREWVRTYRGHARGGPPLEALGAQDITCEVAVDQLPPADDQTSQADWLRRHGIEALVAEGRAQWAERASVGDLAAVRARSRVIEAEALIDESGLGAFTVLEWPG